MNTENKVISNEVWKQYKRKGLSEMRPYIKGEGLSGISISNEDNNLPTLEGGYIARNPKNHADQWYVAKKYFDDNLEPISSNVREDEKTFKYFNDWWNTLKPQYKTPEIIFDHFKRYKDTYFPPVEQDEATKRFIKETRDFDDFAEQYNNDPSNFEQSNKEEQVSIAQEVCTEHKWGRFGEDFIFQCVKCGAPKPVEQLPIEEKKPIDYYRSGYQHYRSFHAKVPYDEASELTMKDGFDKYLQSLNNNK